MKGQPRGTVLGHLGIWRANSDRIPLMQIVADKGDGRARFTRISSIPPVGSGVVPRAGSFNNDELSRSVETALTQTRAQAVPAASDITRGAGRLNENAACQGRHTQAEWHDVQRTLHAKRRLSM